MLQTIKKELETNPDTLTKEISILYELGLEDYEIEYLIYLKTKEIASKKWD